MSTHGIDPKTVRALAEILSDTGLTEIEVETKEGRIRLAHTPAPVTQHVFAAGAPAVTARCWWAEWWLLLPAPPPPL